MKRNVSRPSRNSGGDQNPMAIRLAQTYISRQPQEEVELLGQLFPRDPVQAKRTEDAIMAGVLVLGPPSRLTQHRKIFTSRPFNWAMTLAAALIIALVSSLVTLGVLKSSSMVSIRFVLSAPEAQSVTLVADFNNWSSEGYSLARSDETGDWELLVPLRKGRSYVYNFVIDGEDWLPDPSAQGTIDDGLGGQASFISL